MRDVRTLTLEQSRKLNSYYDFYSRDLLEIFGKTNVENLEIIKDEPYYHSYLNIVKRTAELAHKLNMDDPVSVCIIFEYLLWNGYMSKDHKLVFSSSDRINNMAITGADIMRGKSVCLNNADMLTDILRELGITSYTFGCDLRNSKSLEKIEYRPDIDRQVEKSKLKDKLFSSLIDITPFRRMGNHAITLFELNDYLILSDPTNLGFLAFTDFLKARYIGSDVRVDIKPWLPTLLDCMDKDELDHLVFRSFILSDYNPLSIEKIRNISELVLKILNSSNCLLDKYYENNQKDIDIVCKTLTKK